MGASVALAELVVALGPSHPLGFDYGPGIAVPLLALASGIVGALVCVVVAWIRRKAP
jgi:hypothetical protein